VSILEPDAVIENLAMIRRNIPQMAETCREAERLINEAQGWKRLANGLQEALNREVEWAKSAGAPK
jgi:hypothetical protein